MSSPVGFWSYARSDDAHSDGQLSQLRTIVGKAIALQYGADINIWQDIQAIPPGADWAASIERTISQTVFFIPIVTPRYLKSTHCFAEFHSFRSRMVDLSHDDLIFPILYVGVDHIDADETVFGDELQALRRHQWIDFRPLRHADPRSHEVGMWVDGLAENILKVAVPVSKAELVADKSRQILAAAAGAVREREAPSKTEDGARRRETQEAVPQEAQREQAKRLIDEARQRSTEAKAAQAVPAPPPPSPSPSPQAAHVTDAAAIRAVRPPQPARAAAADAFTQGPAEPPMTAPIAVPPARPRIALWVAAGCGLIVVAAGAAMMFRQREPTPAPPAPPVIASTPAAPVPPAIASAPTPTPTPTPTPAPTPTPVVPPASVAAAPPRAPDLQGSVDQMLDSGALIVGGKIVNLDGVRGQSGRGASAMQHYLESEGNVVQCFSHDEAYQCFANGKDVGLHALRQGWARARPGAPPQYAAAEAGARSARAGIWAH